jgi:hypothetical protein
MMLCPCGCRRLVKPGKRFGHGSCYMRSRTPAQRRWHSRQGGLTSGLTRRDRIVHRFLRMSPEDGIFAAYRAGYHLGYQRARGYGAYRKAQKAIKEVA